MFHFYFNHKFHFYPKETCLPSNKKGKYNIFLIDIKIYVLCNPNTHETKVVKIEILHRIERG